MIKRYEDERLRGWLNRLKRLFKRNPEAPEDPNSYVMAPRRNPDRQLAVPLPSPSGLKTSH